MTKSLALLSLVVGLHTLVCQALDALTRAFSFFTLLEKGFLELVQHDLEVFDILHAELGHVLLELSFLIVDLFDILCAELELAQKQWRQ